MSDERRRQLAQHWQQAEAELKRLTDLAVRRTGDQPVDIKLAEERLHAKLNEIEGELGEAYLRELREDRGERGDR